MLSGDYHQNLLVINLRVTSKSTGLNHQVVIVWPLMLLLVCLCHFSRCLQPKATLMSTMLLLNVKKKKKTAGSHHQLFIYRHFVPRVLSDWGFGLACPLEILRARLSMLTRKTTGNLMQLNKAQKTHCKTLVSRLSSNNSSLKFSLSSIE